MNTLSSSSTGFAAPLARVVVDYVTAQGHDASAVQQALGLNAEQLADLSQRVPAQRLATALAVASRVCGDPHVAIRIAEMIRPAHLGTLGYALISSPNVSDALALFDRMQRLLCNEMQTHLTMVNQAIEVRCESLSPMPRDPHLWTFIVCARLSFARWVMGRPLVPLQIDMPCPAPAQLQPLLTHLGCPVRFDALQAREVLPIDWLSLPNPNSDPSLHKMMSSMADQFWNARLEAPDEVITHLRQLITLSLHKGQAPALDALLPELSHAGCTSVRQLQRRLAEHGLSFKELVEQIRKNQVLNDLQHTDLSLSQVAQRAAYAEPASFHRAVKRWTGITPMAFRVQRKTP